MAMLYFSKQIPEYTQLQKGKFWKQKLSCNLSNKKLLIVGYGKVGAQVATRAMTAFGMNVIGIKRIKELSFKESSNIKILQSNQKNINQCLQEADFILNCLPSTEKTYKFFNAQKFQLMQATRRGTTVNEQDLIQALDLDKIKGFATDVTYYQPLPKSSKLWDLKNVLILPHSAVRTPNEHVKRIQVYIEEIGKFCEGIQLGNRVNIAQGY